MKPTEAAALSRSILNSVDLSHSETDAREENECSISAAARALAAVVHSNFTQGDKNKCWSGNTQTAAPAGENWLTIATPGHAPDCSGKCWRVRSSITHGAYSAQHALHTNAEAKTHLVYETM